MSQFCCLPEIWQLCYVFICWMHGADSELKMLNKVNFSQKSSKVRWKIVIDETQAYKLCFFLLAHAPKVASESLSVKPVVLLPPVLH